jgi:hypothetical protein
MNKPCTITFGLDTPGDYGPASVLAAMGVPPLAEEERCELAARVLFLPSFHPEVCLTIQRTGDEATICLVTLQTNLWSWRCYEMQVANGKRTPDDPRPREPERRKETRHLTSARFSDFAEQLAVLRPAEIEDIPSATLDGMQRCCEHRDRSGVHGFRFWHSPADHPGALFVRQVYDVAIELLREEPSLAVLESLHGYLGLGLSAKHFPGRPYVVRIFGSLAASDRRALETSLAKVPAEVPLLLDLSNFDGMGALLHPVLRELHRRSGPTVYWATGERARMHLEAIGVATSVIFGSREDALAALGAV